jgi:hypothetical protein
MTAHSVVRQPSVLLTFRAENARSFRDEVEFSLLATALAEKDAVLRVPWREGDATLAVLPAAGIFGANASGKTNILRLMDDMRSHVLHSFRHGDPTGGIHRRPFLLDQDSREAPTRYEIELILNGIRHEYGFILDDTEILEEWAFWYPKGRPALIFRRERAEVEFGSVERQRSRAVLDLLRPNALFLSTAASANHPALLPLWDWFSRNLRLAEADSRPTRQALTTKMLADPDRRDQVLALLQAADLGVVDAKKATMDPEMQDRLRRAVLILNGIEEDSDSGPSFDFDALGVRLIHRGDAGEVEFEAGDESLGTLVWFGVIGAVVEALDNGSVFLADELDASLHPALGEALMRLFQDPDTNPNRAQFIFNSHDSALLGDAVGERLLGRDQIWFTEKRKDGTSRLYPLADFEPRKQEAVGKRYLAGRYGATPILSPAEFTSAAHLITAKHS